MVHHFLKTRLKRSLVMKLGSGRLEEVELLQEMGLLLQRLPLEELVLVQQERVEEEEVLFQMRDSQKTSGEWLQLLME